MQILIPKFNIIFKHCCKTIFFKGFLEKLGTSNKHIESN